MKLQEIHENSKPHALKDVIHYSEENVRSATLKDSMDLLIQDERLVYQGPMYRTIALPGQQFQDSFDLRQLHLQVQRYMKEAKRAHYQAWSYSLKGMQQAVKTNAEHEVYADVEGWNISPVLKQNGKGVNVEAVFEAANQDYWLRGEDEVFAQWTESVEIYGFLWGLRDQKFYPVDRINEMLAYARKQMKRSDTFFTPPHQRA